MTMRIEVGLREMNQQFADYIRKVEQGTEIVVTRRGKAIALVTPMGITEPTQENVNIPSSPENNS